MSALRFDLYDGFRGPDEGLPQRGAQPAFWQQGLAELAPQLERLRDEVCDIDMRMVRGEIPVPDGKRPLHSGIYMLPEQSLADYVGDRRGSELARILAVTKRLMAEVDRIVVVGGEQLLSGPRAILEACCQPYFNELSRGDRGSRPRIYFADEHGDNDRMQGLLHLLETHRGRVGTCVDDSWGLVVIGNDDAASETIAAMKRLVAALHVHCGGETNKVMQRVVGIATDGRPMTMLPVASDSLFEVGDDVGERYSVHSAVGILPAALMGINVMKLLEGARSVSENFRSEKLGSNLVLQYVGANQLIEKLHPTSIRQIVVNNRSLMATGDWHRQLVARSLDRVLNYVASDGSSASGAFGYIDVQQWRFDPLPPAEPHGIVSEAEHGSPLATSGGSESSLRATLTIPQVNDICMGQLFQLVMLATVVEARLLGRNPYR